MHSRRTPLPSLFEAAHKDSLIPTLLAYNRGLPKLLILKPGFANCCGTPGFGMHSTAVLSGIC